MSGGAGGRHIDEPPAEISLTAEDVRRLLRTQFPEYAHADICLFSHGWDNDIFRVGPHHAVRIPRRNAAVPLIQHEQRWLAGLSSMLPVAVPVPLAHGAPDEHFPWPWSVVPWVPGTRLCDVSRDDRDAYVQPLAATLRALHVVAPADAPRNPVRGVPLAEREAVAMERMRDHPRLVEIFASAREAALWPRPAVWVHGDLHPANVLVSGGDLAAVIDFGDLCAGDPACDVAVAWFAFSSRGRSEFHDALTGMYDEAVWERARGWAASIGLLLSGVADPSLRAVGVGTLTELLGSVRGTSQA